MGDVGKKIHSNVPVLELVQMANIASFHINAITNFIMQPHLMALWIGTHHTIPTPNITGGSLTDLPMQYLKHLLYLDRPASGC